MVGVTEATMQRAHKAEFNTHIADDDEATLPVDTSELLEAIEWLRDRGFVSSEGPTIS
jgi:type III secretory pathway lipoprotein EscJ